MRFFSINRSIFITFSKIIFFGIICFCSFLLYIEKPKADIFEEKLQREFKNSKNLNAKKRKARKITAKKTNGRVIKYYLIRKSSKQSKKSKEKSAANQMLDAGLITASMVKKNRWFVKKPYETSYTKITSIKNYKPTLIDPLENQKISRKALNLSKKRARDTGPVKPENIYSGDTSLSALKMSKARAIDSRSPISGKAYSESAGRDAFEISKSRASVTGPKKPDILYSERLSRQAQNITKNRSKNLNIARNSPVYSVEMLKSMGKRPPMKPIPFNSNSSSIEKE